MRMTRFVPAVERMPARLAPSEIGIVPIDPTDPNPAPLPDRGVPPDDPSVECPIIIAPAPPPDPLGPMMS